MALTKRQLTLGLLQSWLDVGAMVILSLWCFIRAGQTSLGFCLVTCTFISLISSGSGQTSNEFQPCSKPCSLCTMFALRFILGRTELFSSKSFFIIFKFAFAAHGWTVFLVIFISKVYLLGVKFIRLQKRYFIKRADTFLNTSA